MVLSTFLNNTILLITPGYTGLAEFIGMLTIGVTAGSLGII